GSSLAVLASIAAHSACVALRAASSRRSRRAAACAIAACAWRSVTPQSIAFSAVAKNASEHGDGVPSPKSHAARSLLLAANRNEERAPSSVGCSAACSMLGGQLIALDRVLMLLADARSQLKARDVPDRRRA